MKKSSSKKGGGPTPRATGKTNEIKVGKDPGRVKAFIRVRPFSRDEKARLDTIPFEISEKQTKLKITAEGHLDKSYVFDHIFPPSKTNEDVCKVMTKPLVKAAMNGFNGTLMAYGQTGSGKTYTLMSDTGITRNLIDTTFKHIQEDSKHNYKVTVAYLQIYQEKIFDLLVNGTSKVDLVIRENPRTGVYVENLSEYVVRTPMEVLQFLTAGKKRLVFAETKMNRTSSRSHAVLQMCIERTLKDKEVENKVDDSTDGNSQMNLDASMDADYSVDLNSFGKDVIIRGKIHICDLAGSERIKRTGAAGERLTEAQHINSSLLELGNVIQALADVKITHVPFRNSVLTRLLQESLGGNCKTSLIVCVSPSLRDVQETKCTLNFGSRAMKVTNTAYVNMEVDFKSLSDQLLKQLQTKEEEIHNMKLSLKDEINKECSNLLKKLEEARQEAEMTQELLKRSHLEQVQLLQDRLKTMTDDISHKDGELKMIEDSILVMDDDLKRSKSFALQLITLGEEFKTNLKCCQQNEFNDIVYTFEGMTADILNKEPVLNGDQIMKQLDLLRNKLNTRWMNNKNKSQLELKNKLAYLMELLNDDIKRIMKDQTNHDEQIIQFKTFLRSLLQHVQLSLVMLGLRMQIEITEKENQDLKEKIQKNENQLSEQKVLLQSNLDELDGPKLPKSSSGFKTGVSFIQKISLGLQVSQPKIETVSVGTQLDLPTHEEKKNNDEGKIKGRRLIGTTVEDEERVVTEIQTENVVENSDLRRPRDIFSGFNSTLGRIEDMVASDRKPKHHDSIASRFGLSSYLDEGRSPSRSGSALDYRSDDNMLSRYNNSSPHYKTSINDTFDSKYSCPVRSSSPYRPQKPEYPWSCVANSSPIQGSSSIENLSNRHQFNSSISSDRPCMACGHGSSIDDKTVSKITNLEIEVSKLRHENREHTVLLDGLSRVYPNDGKVYALKAKLRSKLYSTDISTQTGDFEVKRIARDQNNIKVATIKPLPSENRLSQHIDKTNTINVTYGMNENNVLENIASAHVSYEPQGTTSRNLNNDNGDNTNTVVSSSNPNSPTNHRSIDRNGWKSKSSVYNHKKTFGNNRNLIEFSPDDDYMNDIETIRSSQDLSSSIFKNLRQEQNISNVPFHTSPSPSSYTNRLSEKEPLGQRRSSGTARDRPQTWYGFVPENKDIKNFHTPLEAEYSNRALNILSESSKDEIVFSSSRRGSWALPDWMKTKKKSSNSNVRQFIQ